MKAPLFLAIKRISGGFGHLTKAANHNRRTHGAASADPDLSHRNLILRGPATAADITALAHQRIEEAGPGKLRKDAVLALEILFSLPADTTVDLPQYFEDCTVWVARHFNGEQNILSSDVHLDEAAPHCHVLVLPLVDGGMRGSAMFGDRFKLQSRQATFYEEVGARYGLRKPAPRLSGRAMINGVQDVLRRLEDDSDAALVSSCWEEFKAAIERHPDPFMEKLGIVKRTTAAPSKTFEQIALSTGRGPKTESGQASRDRQLGRTWGSDQHLPLATAGTAEPYRLCSSGPAEPPRTAKPILCRLPLDRSASPATGTLCEAAAQPATPGSSASPQADTAAGLQAPAELAYTTPPMYTRDREDDLPAAAWDGESGMFHKPTLREQSQKAWARDSVAALLRKPEPETA